MTGPMIALIAMGGILLIVILWVVGMYNGLVRMRNMVREAWSQIDVQLKRRHDLIPNLVETVKGYAGHERGTLEAVIQARSAAVNAKGVEQQAQAEAGLSGALGKLMLLVEQYPNLKANENFLALQEELTATENRIGFSRQHYNEQTMQYNTSVQSFPNNIISGMFNFTAQPFFEIADAAERQAPRVKF